MHDMMLSRRLWSFIASLLGLFWLFVVSSRSISSTPFRGTSRPSISKATHNRSLGFGEILMAVLPQRTDQRDAISLLAHYSDIDITIVDGVPKDEILEKTLPKGKYRPEGGQLGCWRAHMNMLRMVVDKKLETALILEADMDWDVRVKDQLSAVSDNLQDATPDYPYGKNWSYFWIGHCWHAADPARLGPVTVFTDNTINPLKQQSEWIQNDAKAYGVEGDGQRMIYQANNPLCTGAYAVTLHGALTMLYEIGYDHLDNAIDKEYQKAVHRGKIPGMAVTPPLMSQWKDGSSKDSDINVKVMERPEEMNPGHDKGSSGGSIQVSARKALKEWTFGKGT